MDNLFLIDAALSNKKETADFEINLKEGRGNVYNLVLFLTDVMFSYDGDNYFFVQKNHVILYPPNQLNCFKNAGGEYFNNSFVCFNTVNETALSVDFPISKLIELTDAQVRAIDAKIDRISFLFNTNYEPESVAEIDECLSSALGIIEKAYATSDQIKQEINLSAKFIKLRDKLYKEPEKFSIKDLADSLNYSLTWFGILYKKQFGVSPIRDKELALVNKIKKSLLKEGKPLETIAEELNLSSASYIIRLFKRLEGVSPYQYKLLKQNPKYKKRRR